MPMNSYLSKSSSIKTVIFFLEIMFNGLIVAPLLSKAAKGRFEFPNYRDRGATLRLGDMTEYWGGHNSLFLSNSL